MLWRSITLIFVLTLLSAKFSRAEEFAPAAEPMQNREPVTATELILVGKGMMDSKTGESLALTCTDSDCQTMRFVLFISANEAYYIGSPVIRPPEKQQKAFVKHLFKGFKHWRRDHRGMSRDTRDAITAASFMISTFGPATIAMMAGSLGPSMGLSLAVFPFYLLLTPMITGDIKVFSGAQRTTKATLDQQGWNWSDKPAQIKHKTFGYLIEYFDDR